MKRKLLYFDVFIKECADNDFRCVEGGRYCDGMWGDDYDNCLDTPCVPVGWRCNGDEDCTDGSDEKGCDGIIEKLLILGIATQEVHLLQVLQLSRIIHIFVAHRLSGQ